MDLRRRLMANNVGSALSTLLTSGQTFYAPFADKGSGEVSLVASGAGASQSPTFTRATTATTVNSAGLIVSVASGTPRSYYDPTSLAYMGYLAEGARTNLCLHSAGFDNAAWVKVNCTVTADAIAAPDGTTSADAMVATAIISGLQQNFVKAASAITYTFSVFIKAGTKSWVVVTLDDGLSNGSRYWFNLSGAGAVGSTTNFGTGLTGLSASISAAANGFYRVVFTATSNTTVAFRPLITAADSDGTFSSATSGTLLYVWGAQLEAGSFASSYIPTTTVSVARNADVLTYPVSGNISGTTGSVYLETAKSATSATMIGNTPILGFGDVGVNGNILLKQGGSSALFSHDVTGFIALGVNIADTTTLQKIAAAYAPSVVTGAVSGTVGSPVATDGNFNAGASFYVGCIPTPSGNSYFGTIRNVRIYQTQLSAAQLQAVTA